MSHDIRWNLTAQTPDIFGIDARAFIPMLLVIIHIRLWTLGLAVISIAIFALLGMKGLTLPVLVRKITHKLAGMSRAARPWWFWRRFRVPWWRYKVWA